MYDSITVLPGPPEEPRQQRSTSPATEHSESDVEEPRPVDPQILLQELATIDIQELVSGGTIGGVKASGKPSKGKFTTKKFAEEDFGQKPGQIRMAKLARDIDPNDEDKPATMHEAIDHRS